MHIMLVYIHVKPESVEAFKAASEDNARNSVQEPGCARFDVIQQHDDPNRFVLYEAYHDRSDHAAHRETEHYKRWKETVDDMMAEKRYAVHYSNVHPGNDGW